MDRPLFWTGILHGIYGLGAFASPLVATAIVSRQVPVRCLQLSQKREHFTMVDPVSFFLLNKRRHECTRLFTGLVRISRPSCRPATTYTVEHSRAQSFQFCDPRHLEKQNGMDIGYLLDVIRRVGVFYDFSGNIIH